MTTRVPTPPEGEQRRQKMVHSLRMARVAAAKDLYRSAYTDTDAMLYIIQINAQISALRSLKEPFPEGEDIDEPGLEEIESRGLNWYWEEWRVEDEEDDDDVDG